MYVSNFAESMVHNMVKVYSTSIVSCKHFTKYVCAYRVTQLVNENYFLFSAHNKISPDNKEHYLDLTLNLYILAPALLLSGLKDRMVSRFIVIFALAIDVQNYNLRCK